MPRIIEAELGNPEHRRAIVRLNVDFAAVSGAGLAPDHDAGLDALLRDHPTVFAFLALDDDGSAIGYALCQFTITSFSAGPAANLHDVYVAEASRGLGLGREMIERFEARARAHGCRKLSLEVSHDNVGAQRLYRSLGFHDDHEDRDGDGTWSWYRHLH